MFHYPVMKTVTIRALRLEWPRIERGLAHEGELVVTRDGEPVARLLPFAPPQVAPRAIFSAADNERWLKRVHRGARLRGSVDSELARDRAER